MNDKHDTHVIGIVSSVDDYIMFCRVYLNICTYTQLFESTNSC